MNRSYFSVFGLAVCALLLSACGGGGGSGPEVSGPVVPTPAPVVLSANPTARIFQEGLYLYAGFGLIVGDVKQSFISKTTIDASGRESVSVEATRATTLSTPPSVFGAIQGAREGYLYEDGSRRLFDFLSKGAIAYSETEGDATVLNETRAELGWKIKFSSVDVAGQTVASQIKRLDGSTFNEASLGLANPSQTFAPGSKAYFPEFVATKNMTVIGRRNAFVYYESELINSGWCQTVAGTSEQLAIVFSPDGKLNIYVVPGDRCSIASLSPMAVGSWSKTTVGGNTAYVLNYPDSLKTGPWAAGFAYSYYPEARIPDRVLQVPSGSTMFYYGYSVPAGATFRPQQPFFNPAALSSLRAASGL